MYFREAMAIVHGEVQSCLSKVDESEVGALIEQIARANRIFVVGVGRVMLMIQAFAKRLKHLQFDSVVVGETITPAIGEEDLLIAASGSGETLTTITVMRLAKKHGAQVALITASNQSTAKAIADSSVRIPCPTKFHRPEETPSKQPMTSLFEQCLLFFCDCTSLMLQDEMNISEEDLWNAHSNLE
jgi:6-phospho-3-hexuloisomerase